MDQGSDLGIALKEVVVEVFELSTFDIETARLPPEFRRSFPEGDIETGLRQPLCGGQTGDASADDGDFLPIRHGELPIEKKSGPLGRTALDV
jgi:hypothetical protein